MLHVLHTQSSPLKKWPHLLSCSQLLPANDYILLENENDEVLKVLYSLV